MNRRRLTTRLTTILTATATLLAGGAVAASAPPLAAAAAGPKVTVTKVVGGLAYPWDVTFMGGLMMYDLRGGSIWTKRGSAAPKRVRLALPRTFAESEAGMMGLVADPGGARNHYFYTCQAVATAKGAAKDVEVWKWRLDSDTAATKVKVLITGIPLKSGRHSGCRLRFRSAHMLYVGTGDAAKGTNPQNLQSLGGKILRVRDDGTIPTSNPFYRRGGNARYVWNYGHRNVQGLVKRAGRSELWSVEQGTNRNDEVNLVWSGRNYGYNPVPGYNESVPMTDKNRYPSAVSAAWSSGYPTVATSGASFINGAQWGSWNGVLAVAMLKGTGIKLFTINSSNKITGSQTVMRGYGRIRTVQQGAGGAVYFTTSNGSKDGIFRMTAG
jgi:glucose/arabinose dehydrogenase